MDNRDGGGEPVEIQEFVQRQTASGGDMVYDNAVFYGIDNHLKHL
jgi:hypothetical protein